MFKVYFDELAIIDQDGKRLNFSTMLSLLQTLGGLVADDKKIYKRVKQLIKEEERKNKNKKV